MLGSKRRISSKVIGSRRDGVNEENNALCDAGFRKVILSNFLLIHKAE